MEKDREFYRKRQEQERAQDTQIQQYSLKGINADFWQIIVRAENRRGNLEEICLSVALESHRQPRWFSGRMSWELMGYCMILQSVI